MAAPGLGSPDDLLFWRESAKWVKGLQFTPRDRGGLLGVSRGYRLLRRSLARARIHRLTEAALAGPTPVRWQDATIVARQTQTPKRPASPAPSHRSLQLARRTARRHSSHSCGRLSRCPQLLHRLLRRMSSRVIELAIERLADGEVSPFFHDIALVWRHRLKLEGPLGGVTSYGGRSITAQCCWSAPGPASCHSWQDDPPSRGHARCAPVPPASRSPDLSPTLLDRNQV